MKTEDEIKKDIVDLELSMDWASNPYQKNWYRGAISALKDVLKSPKTKPGGERNHGKYR